MFKLKSYVRNKNRPEGSMAEGYIVEECMTFVSRYLDVVETRGNRGTRNQEERGRPLYGGSVVRLCREELDTAHRWILFNSDSVAPYVE